MSSALESYEEAGRQKQSIEKCLNRCQEYRGPSRDRLARIFVLRTQMNVVFARVEAAQSRIQKSTRVEWDAASADLEEAKKSAASGNADGQQRVALLQSQIAEHKAANSRRVAAAMAAEDPEMSEASADLGRLLDTAGSLELEIQGADALKQAVTADFASKSKDFEEAEQYHKKQAMGMLVGLVFIILMIVVLTYFLFISPTAIPRVTESEPALEKWIVVGVGRLAVLIFAGWALKYVAGLHKAHAEQTIICRDRRAALGVAQNILEAAPSLDEKRALLRTLTEKYLSFDQNAFTTSRNRPDSETGDDDVKRLKELVKAVKPIFDSVKCARRVIMITKIAAS